MAEEKKSVAQLINENKKKLIALILAIVLGALGIQLSDDQQAGIVNTIDQVVPNVPESDKPQ